MQILGLLGMYFDAVVVEVEKYLLCFQIGSGQVACDFVCKRIKNQKIVGVTSLHG